MPKTYETTRHRLSVPTSSGEPHEIKRYDILANGAAFCLQNFFSEAECQDIIMQAETMGLEDCCYSMRIRKCDRIVATSEDLANTIYERIKPYVHPVDLKSRKSPAWYPEGVSRAMAPYVWFPSEINDCFRICRYEKGGFFLPHHDGGFRKNDHCQSIQTFMVYLNDKFDGGATGFYNESQRHYEKPDPDNLVHLYQPKTGDALVFNSQIVHDGGVLKSGHKYILRSEVMYSPMEEIEVANDQKKSAEPDHDPKAELSWP